MRNRPFFNYKTYYNSKIYKINDNMYVDEKQPDKIS